jgi:hypothetical protein
MQPSNNGLKLTSPPGSCRAGIGAALQLNPVFDGPREMKKQSRDSDGDVHVRHSPKNRDESESKLRRGRRHCPLCLQALPRISGKGRLAHKCTSCTAQPQPGKRCARCNQEAVWEAGASAACQACGFHGSKIRVIAGTLEEPQKPRAGKRTGL